MSENIRIEQLYMGQDAPTQEVEFIRKRDKTL